MTLSTRLSYSRWMDTLWLILLAGYILAGAASVPLHGDETTFVFMGRDFYYHVAPDNRASVAYQNVENLSPFAVTEQQLRLRNGTVMKYLFGTTAYASGYSIDEINNQWAWNSGWDWNHANGHVPDDQLLYRTRLVSALLTAGGALVLFGIGMQISGRGVAYLASGLYTLHPVILLNGRRAMQEGGMLFFSLLVVFAALVLLRHHRRWWLYIALGISSGISVATKHTAAATVSAVFIVCGAYWLLKQRDGRALAALVAAGVLSLIVFYVLNPAWWNEPVEIAAYVLQDRVQFTDDVVSNFGGYDTLGDQLGGFWRQAFVADPMYAETTIDGFIEQQRDVIQQYEQSPWSGVVPGMAGGIVSLILTITGFVALWRDTTFDVASRWLLTGWSITMILLTAFVTPLEWQRYYIPVYPALILLSAIGIRFLWRRLSALVTS